MKRIYQELIAQHLSKLRQMIFLMGPRQAGKTTLSLESVQEWPSHFYLSWDTPTDKLLFIEGPKAVAKQAGLEEILKQMPVLIFDEIHKFGKWKNFLKGFFDL
jgi:predicted AAA+ superfamily ATPase